MKRNVCKSTFGIALLAVMPGAFADVSAETIRSISTPDRVESRIGALEFKDGAPNQATLDKVYDHVDFTHAYDAFVNTMAGKGWFTLLRLYSPLEPFFNKSWRPTEIELIK